MSDDHDTAGPVPPEPVTPGPPRRIARPLLTQTWLDAAFLHWEVPTGAVAPLLPAGTAPDTFDGASYVGLVAFRMHRVGWLRLPGIPYFGTFPETNIRLYSVDREGRRGVVFRSLDAARLVPVLAARLGFRLPYLWARMGIDADGDVRTYTGERRWPGPRGTRSRISVRIGEPIAEPTALEHFLTARWALHNAAAGGTVRLANEHPQWPLHRAELLECEDGFVAAAGLPVEGGPMSVLYSPGVDVRFTGPHRLAPGDGPGAGGISFRA